MCVHIYVSVRDHQHCSQAACQTKTKWDQTERRPRSVRVPTVHDNFIYNVDPAHKRPSSKYSHWSTFLPNPAEKKLKTLNFPFMINNKLACWVTFRWWICFERRLRQQKHIYLSTEKKKKRNVGKCVNDLLDFLQPQFSIVTDFQYVATSAQHNKLSSVIA